MGRPITDETIAKRDAVTHASLYGITSSWLVRLSSTAPPITAAANAVRSVSLTSIANPT